MREVPITVAEVDPFAATAERAGLTDEERTAVTDFIARNPDAGDRIPGTGGLRKLRWPGKGKGKRGGYRVIYYFFDTGVPVLSARGLSEEPADRSDAGSEEAPCAARGPAQGCSSHVESDVE